MTFSRHAIGYLVFLIVIFCTVPVLAFEAGEPAPDFALPTLAGKKVRLSDYRGQTVLLKLATTWCPTCKELTEELERASADLAKYNVALLEVFVQDSDKMVESYTREASYPMPYEALLDDGQAYRAYNVYLIPRFLLIDAEQVIRFDSAGRNVNADEIVALVKEYTVPPVAAEDTAASEK